MPMSDEGFPRPGSRAAGAALLAWCYIVCFGNSRVAETRVRPTSYAEGQGKESSSPPSVVNSSRCPAVRLYNNCDFRLSDEFLTVYKPGKVRNAQKSSVDCANKYARSRSSSRDARPERRSLSSSSWMRAQRSGRIRTQSLLASSVTL